MRTLLVLLVFLSMHAAAADTSAVTAAKAIEGVYKQRFTNGMITPGKAPGEQDTPYQSENIVEIVRHDDQHVYVRASLQFYNGHSCSIYGMARHEGDGFVFRDPEPAYDGGQRCTLTVAQSGDAITLTDRVTPDGVATCKSYCGMRGSLSDVALPMASRRTIRYMERLRESREYRQAAKQLAEPTR